MGFEQVFSVAGGTAAWSEAGKPLDVADHDELAPRVIETEWAHAGGGRMARTRSPFSNSAPFPSTFSSPIVPERPPRSAMSRRQFQWRFA
jgi:hypothetical protein